MQKRYVLGAGMVAVIAASGCATQTQAPAKVSEAKPAEAKPAAVWPEGLPKTALYNPEGKNKTLWPQPVKNSGELKYNEHARDLSKWLTRDPADMRPLPKPMTVSLNGQPLNGDAARGKEIAMNTGRGNCWACHALPGDAQPGSSGPPLIGFKSRGYSDDMVYQFVYDRRAVNPNTVMPPFGAIGNLSDQEVRDVVAYLQSLN
jgi:sulfur oxidation c-type cytochrome SoxX